MPIGSTVAASSAVSASDWASVLTAMTGQISVSTVVGVLASVVGAGIAVNSNHVKCVVCHCFAGSLHRFRRKL